jgi:hypothetical protein
MTHKMSWLIIAVGLVGIGVGATFLVTSRTGRPAASTDDAQQALIDRLERLETRVPELKRGLAHSGAQMGALALNGALAAGKTQAVEEDESPEGQALAKVRAAESAEKESRHYDRLDELARAGGGAAAAGKLRKNIEGARVKGVKAGGGELDIARLECSDALCRIEVRSTGNDVAASSMAGLQILSPGMGPLTMRPYSPGQPSVFYVAAPGQRLPKHDF